MQLGAPFGLAAGIVLLSFWVIFGTVGFTIVEGWSPTDSFYMTVITISTVGFREVHPLSANGRMFASFIIIAGLGTAVYTFTRLGQLVLEGELLDILGRRRMKSDLEKMQDHFIICGFGRIGRPVVEDLSDDGLRLVVVERDLEVFEDLLERGYASVHGDATEEDVLEQAGIQRARALLALLPSDADNLYLTMSAKSLNDSLVVIARASDDRSEVKIKRAGADRVVSATRIAATRLLQAALKPTLMDFMELVTLRDYLPLNLEEIVVEQASQLCGVRLADSDIRRGCGVMIVAIKKSDGQMVFNPDPVAEIAAGDTLVALGEKESLEGLERVSEGRA